MPKLGSNRFAVDRGFAVIKPVSKGWQYTLFVGAELDVDGSVDKTSADEMLAGWAPTKGRARKKALERGSDA